MDKVKNAVYFFTLILISLACLTYMWRQYKDYKYRDEAWVFCAKWAYDEAKSLSRSETLLLQECMQRIKP